MFVLLSATLVLHASYQSQWRGEQTEAAEVLVVRLPQRYDISRRLTSASTLVRPLLKPADCALFPARSQLSGIPLSPSSRISSTAELGPPSVDLLWDELAVSCPAAPFPLMEPPFSHYCELAAASPHLPPAEAVPAAMSWTQRVGPADKPGFVHLCHGRNHSGTAVLVVKDAFVGPSPRYFLHNITHSFLFNPWYPKHPFSTEQHLVAYTAAQTVVCYEEVAWLKSAHDDSVGPHTVLEVAPILSFMLDRIPNHVPILLTLSPSLLAAYATLGLNSSRLVALQSGVVYHARRMWWIRRPEEFSDKYWSSLRRRLFPQPLSPLPAPDTSHRALIVVLKRGKSERSVTNHDELMQVVLDAFDDSVYEVSVFDGTLSLHDSISFFSRALLVVGPHGGAFLNELFMPPLSILVEIAYPDQSAMAFPSYYYLQSCGLRLWHWIVMADSGSYGSPMSVNTSEVVHIMQQAIAMRQEEMQAAAVDEASRGARMQHGSMVLQATERHEWTSKSALLDWESHRERL